MTNDWFMFHLNDTHYCSGTTHIIVLGMNPVNIRLPVPQNVENDIKAVDFATKMDVLIKDLVRSKYDCSFLSIIDSCMTADVCERPFSIRYIWVP